MKHLNMSVASLALIAAAGPAIGQTAQTAAAQESSGVPDIVVTATRTETNLQSTPIAVTALSGATLQQRGAVSLLDVQNSTPSLTVSSRSTTGAQRGGFTIRGIGVDSINSSAAVGLYVDEVYYPSAAGNLLGLFDVERIEVLRGPQGTLFGRNTIAGAVQYITRKPDQELGGFLTGTYGNLDRAEVAGALNLPITDTLAVRASARYNRLGGYVLDELNGFKRGRETLKQGRVAVRWQPDPTLTIDLKGEMLDLKNNGRAMELLGFNTSLNPPGTPNPGAALVFAAVGSGLNPAQIFTIRPSTRNFRFQGLNATDRQDFDFKTAQANVVWDLTENVRLKSITAYSYSRETALVDIDNTILPIIGGSRGRSTDKLFTQELQLSGDAFNNRLHYTVGGFYYDQQSTIRDQFFFFGPSPLAINPSLGDIGNDTTALAAYGQLTFDFTEQFSATAGLRYSDEEAKGRFLNARVPNVPALMGGPGSPGVPLTLPAFFAPFERSFSDWSPSFGLNFQANSDLLIYAKASKGFRAGGVAVNGNLTNPPAPFPPVTTTPGYQPFGQETAWTYELGTRLQLFDRRLRFNPTLFYTDWKDIQFTSFIFTGNPPTPNVIARNAGDARIWGIELEWDAVVTDRFNLYGSFSYLNSKYKRIAPGIDVTVRDDLQHTPEFKYNIGARYTLPVSDNDRVVFGADYAWTDDQRSAVSNGDFITQPSYGLLNTRVQLDLNDNRFSIAAYATNLTNEHYFIGGVNGSLTFGSVEADIGRPREYGLTATVRF